MIVLERLYHEHMSGTLVPVSSNILHPCGEWPLAHLGPARPQGIRQRLAGNTAARMLVTTLTGLTLLVFALSILLAPFPLFLLVMPLGFFSMGVFLWEESHMYRRLEAEARPDHWSRLVDIETVPQYKIETSGDEVVVRLRLVKVDWRAATSPANAREVLEEYLFTDPHDIDAAVEAKLRLVDRRDELNHITRVEYLASLESAQRMHTLRDLVRAA